MIGVWRRLVLERPGKVIDDVSDVVWLQGPRFFADLRQPPGKPDFGGVRCLADLTPDHLTWLATQEGFAGSFSLADGIALWDRRIDFQPKTGIRDRATVSLDGDHLHERGTETPYYEKWLRAAQPRTPALALELRCRQTQCTGYVVRAGASFMFVRDRAQPLPEGGSLGALLASARDAAAMRALVDCEISFGEIADDGRWRITRSTLPFRVGEALSLQDRSAGGIETGDITPDGRPFRRPWRVVARHEIPESPQPGNRDAFHAVRPDGSAAVTMGPE